MHYKKPSHIQGVKPGGVVMRVCLFGRKSMETPTTKSVLAETEQEAVAKQKWETPLLSTLDVEETESGATPGQQESTLKHPGS
jgi:hypothetical protein